MNIYEHFPEPKSRHHLNRYFKFISFLSNAQRGVGNYKENHHILPKSLGGSDASDNLISLSYREHFIAHFMLWLAYRNVKMTRAFWCMRIKGNKQNERYFKLNSKLYEKLKEADADGRKGQGNPMFGRRLTEDQRKQNSIRLKQEYKEGKRIPAFKGKHLSNEHKLNVSKSLSGVKKPEGFGEKIRKLRTGTKRSSNTKQKCKNWHQNKMWVKNYNLMKETQIQYDKFSEFLESGWVRGRFTYCEKKK